MTKVLMFDDNMDDLLIILQIKLERLNNEVLSTWGGVDADRIIEATREQNPDVVIIGKPDPVPIIRYLRASTVTSNIPILVVTVYKKELRQELRELHCEVLLKPVMLIDLINTARSLSGLDNIDSSDFDLGSFLIGGQL